MAPAPTPRRCIPALGPRAAPLPGTRVSASRDLPPAPQRGSAARASSARAGSYAPTSCRGAAGLPPPGAWASLFAGGRAPQSPASGKARVWDASPQPPLCGSVLPTNVDASDPLVFPPLPLHRYPSHQCSLAANFVAGAELGTQCSIQSTNQNPFYTNGAYLLESHAEILTGEGLTVKNWDSGIRLVP